MDSSSSADGGATKAVRIPSPTAAVENHPPRQRVSSGSDDSEVSNAAVVLSADDIKFASERAGPLRPPALIVTGEGASIAPFPMRSREPSIDPLQALAEDFGTGTDADGDDTHSKSPQLHPQEQQQQQSSRGEFASDGDGEDSATGLVQALKLPPPKRKASMSKDKRRGSSGNGSDLPAARPSPLSSPPQSATLRADPTVASPVGGLRSPVVDPGLLGVNIGADFASGSFGSNPSFSSPPLAPSTVRKQSLGRLPRSRSNLTGKPTVYNELSSEFGGVAPPSLRSPRGGYDSDSLSPRGGVANDSQSSYDSASLQSTRRRESGQAELAALMPVANGDSLNGTGSSSNDAVNAASVPIVPASAVTLPQAFATTAAVDNRPAPPLTAGDVPTDGAKDAAPEHELPPLPLSPPPRTLSALTAALIRSESKSASEMGSPASGTSSPRRRLSLEAPRGVSNGHADPSAGFDSPTPA